MTQKTALVTSSKLVLGSRRVEPLDRRVRGARASALVERALIGGLALSYHWLTGVRPGRKITPTPAGSHLGNRELLED